MQPAHARPSQLNNLPSLDELRKRDLSATLQLLGDTISISEQAWQEPSLLPGWTRAHIATHLARNADALLRVITGLVNDQPCVMYPDENARFWDIERGSERNGLALQIDLDTTAGLLSETFELLAELPDDQSVELMPQLHYQASLLPLIRINEVVLHHVDLDCGFDITQVDPGLAQLLLRFHIDQLTSEEYCVKLITDSGFETELGTGDKQIELAGSDAALLGWFSGRLRPETAHALGLPDHSLIS